MQKNFLLKLPRMRWDGFHLNDISASWDRPAEDSTYYDTHEAAK